MAPTLFAHPLSSYCQKVLTALYEMEVDFEFRLLSSDNPAAGEEFASLWPVQRMPLLLDDGRPVMESTIIIEHVGLGRPEAARMVPADPAAALEARMLDRVFDNYVMTPMQRIVFDALRAAEKRDAQGVEEARALLDRAYGWLDGKLARREWAAGSGFGLADCAAAPSLFYAHWVHPIPEHLATLRAYRSRLLARPSFARAVDEARPYRKFFPLPIPEID